MPEITLPQYLEQIDHCLEELREPENMERDKEINEIQKKVRGYLQGITRVDTKQMKMCVLAGLDEVAPRIEKLVSTAAVTRDTWPMPEPADVP